MGVPEEVHNAVVDLVTAQWVYEGKDDEILDEILAGILLAASGLFCLVSFVEQDHPRLKEIAKRLTIAGFEAVEEFKYTEN